MPAPPQTLAPLQRHAEELLARLKRKGTTRGDVIVAIQASVDDMVLAIAAEICPLCKDDGRPRLGFSHEHEDDCSAERVWEAYEEARPRAWGPSAANPDVKVVTRESWTKAFYMIPRIAAVERAKLREPYLKDLFSIRAFLRYRVEEEYGEIPWWFSRDCMPLLKEGIANGIAPGEMRDLAKRSKGWNWFRDTLTEWIDDEKKKRPT